MQQNQGWTLAPDEQFNLALMFRNKDFWLEIPILFGVRETLIKPSLSGDICLVLANETTMCRF